MCTLCVSLVPFHFEGDVMTVALNHDDYSIWFAYKKGSIRLVVT